MLLNKIKWMAVGVAITASTVLLYNNRDKLTHDIALLIGDEKIPTNEVISTTEVVG